MGGRSSSSQQLTQQYDQRQVNTSTNTFNTSTDAGAVKGAFDFASTLAKLQGATVTDVAGRALDTADSALATIDSTSGKAFNFARDAGSQAFDFASTIAKLSGSQTGRALDSVDSTIGQSLSFVSKALGSASNAQSRATDLVATAYNDAKGRGSMTDTILMVTVVGALVVAAVIAYRK